ncbi:hypothetical protein BS47DRAFT_1333776 [Hydnum rufescens UP504]|uniref:Signal peptidase complex subunit 1 n=1 Tax=Hydnum rufescens UP504 TaxID=1448309 RepID=A0A9P6DPQ5_9AGAM|nr:hypothetical protein BS47DRAFT_1333776 [Hydnum rufescens UP504]
MSSQIRSLLEGKIDFEGQKLAEKIVQIGLISSTIVSFIVGFVVQDLKVAFAILSVATIFIALITLPPWPVYNKHPLPWLKSQNSKKEQ